MHNKYLGKELREGSEEKQGERERHKEGKELKGQQNWNISCPCTWEVSCEILPCVRTHVCIRGQELCVTAVNNSKGKLFPVLQPEVLALRSFHVLEHGNSML